MSRPINYNDWFYKYHHYVKGNRNGLITYNDTKWKNINDRLLPLFESQSSLIDNQPFAVVGNNVGIDKLLNLMQDSNYTFGDVNDALVETYKMNYQNAMSRMVVNTHAVICSFTNKDSKNVHYDSLSNYYIIDVPFDQMHFGERDEFIRQRLQQMHVKSTNVWVHINDLNNISWYKEILEFSIMITMNGLICNDIMVGFDDKGLMFKVRWKRSTDFECIVYKLDTSNVYSIELPISDVAGGSLNISWDRIGGKHVNDDTVTYGIVDMFYPEFTSSLNVPGNICYIDGTGIHVPNIQRATNKMITDTNLNSIRIVVYELKYFFEIPNIYPAMNYYDMMEKNRVKYKDDYVGVNGDSVYAKHINVDYTIHISTPPIVIDRDSTPSYDVTRQVISNDKQMRSYYDDISAIGNLLRSMNDNTPQSTIDEVIVKPIEEIYTYAAKARVTYIKFASLTSLIDQTLINKYDEMVKELKQLYDVRNNRNLIKSTQPNIFLGNAYPTCVSSLYKILNNAMFKTMKLFNTITNNFIVNGSNANRFTRPVSEQCFIVMKYDADDDVWLFCNPNIKHFNGVQNAFYINTGITGKEIFKFFVLYTDTEATGEKWIESMTDETVFDFDKFCDELMEHQSYIRYWTVENKLLKMSNVMFDDYDGSTCMHVLSKMMKHRLNNDLITTYPSEINYEASGISTLGVGNENELESPFTINYLFYTLQLFYNQQDMMLSYFLYRLTHDKYYNRYGDIDISETLNETHPNIVNYSYFWTSPDSIDSSTSSLRTGNNVYQTLPFVVNGSGSIINTPYRYMFNECGYRSYLIENNDIDESFYIDYDDPTQNNAFKNVYNRDIEIAHMLTHYMSMVHDNISSLMTNYTKSFNETKVLSIFKQHVEETVEKFTPLIDDDYLHPDTHNIIDELFGENYTTTNLVYKTIIDLIEQTKLITTLEISGRSTTLYSFIQDLTGLLKRIHLNYGFKDYAVPRARKLYLHMKKINLTMNMYELREWYNNWDSLFIFNIEKYIANNTLYPGINFEPYKRTVRQLERTLSTAIDGLINLYETLNDEYNDQFDTLRDYVWDIYENYIFDMYRMNIEFESIAINNEPLYATITLPSSSRTTHPISGDVVNNVDIVLYPKYQIHNDAYEILELIPICEYAFFDNTKMDNATVNIVTANGTETLNANLTFSKCGSSADIMDSFELINNLNNTRVDIQNIHETFEIVNNVVVNRKHADMKYELLIGNHFNQLPHVTELVLDRDTKLPGSIDRIYATNQMINDYAIDYYGNHHSASMYFKPSQVLHLPIDDDIITSVYGPYCVGQKIYLETYDYQYRFPVIITAIDHSQSRGFIECVVDMDSKWFEITDESKINEYLFDDIECHVIPDNVSNYLNEYNHTDWITYDIVDMTDIPYDELLYFPGDPIFVQTNANYVYTRINWILGENNENRFIDDEHKQYQFKYIGEYQVYDDSFKIKMINHNVDPLTLSEQYPILRREPDDHDVWDGEIAVFESRIDVANHNIQHYEQLIVSYTESMERATTHYDKDFYYRKILDCEQKISYWNAYIARMEYCIKNLEQPTTWYNVGSYNAAMVYIDNGRAELVTSEFVECIMDIPYTDELEIYMYDCQNHKWIDPTSYTITPNIVDGVRFDNPDDFATNNVLHSIDVTFNESQPTQKLLVYIGFRKSDMFENIEHNPSICDVRFKPILSINRNINTDIYNEINIRKHYDGHEHYTFTEDNLPGDIDKADILEGFMVERPTPNGKYTNNPVYRFKDISINNRPYTAFDFYVPIEFPDIDTTESSDYNTYYCIVNVDCDSYQPNTKVDLICISSDKFNGNVSTLTFESVTGDDPDNQSFTIKRCSDDHLPEGSYICMVSSSSVYKSCGGLISVIVSKHENDELKCGNWMKLNNPMYHILPKRFVVSCPSEGGFPYNVMIQNVYYNTETKILNPDNSLPDDPYKYYFSTKYHVRYPISDTRHSDNATRLAIDTNINDNIELVRSPYIGICRYSLNQIPKDGIIDMTGHIPTPLSRDRYEFWVNGRCIKDDKSLYIISPTSIQLCNLNSLHNFECIELVDDMYDSELLPHGNVYIDLYGNYYHTNTYDSFLKMMINNHYIVEQRIDYMFYNLQHQPLYEYTGNVIKNPNNHDAEPNILDGLLLPETTPIDYRNLIHLPMINGSVLYNMSVRSLGIHEIDNKKILNLYNQIWSKDAVINPYIPLHHTTDIMNIPVVKYDKDIENDCYRININGQYDGFFTVYISSIENGEIDDIEHTIQIIPYVNCGIQIVLESIDKYEKKYVHTTTYSQPVKLK